MAFFSRNSIAEQSRAHMAALHEENRRAQAEAEVRHRHLLERYSPMSFAWAEDVESSIIAGVFDHIYRENPSGILLPKAEAIVRTEAEMWADIEKAKDDALASAKKIIDEAADAQERVEINALINSGLTNAKGVVMRMKVLEDKEKAKTLATSIEEYAQIYPVNKFITDATIEMICKKYNLYFTEAKKFIGEIPARCLKEIANFKVRRSDMRYKSTYLSFAVTDETKNDFLPGQGMSVMAPMSELNYREGYDQKRAHILYDDPIILQPVNGGWLIVTSWGKEAADSAIVNPNHN